MSYDKCVFVLGHRFALKKKKEKKEKTIDKSNKIK
jgi:hypothetical protein